MKLSHLPEQYQDVEYEGKLYKGRRDCRGRWEIIKPLIGRHDIVMDLGSSLGYFSKQIALEYPDSLVISFESDPDMIEIQKQLYREKGIYNVVLCQHRLSAQDLVMWMGQVDMFDEILALSVLHHFPSEDVPSVFNALQMMSNKIIGEIPHPKETDACGGNSTHLLHTMIGDKEAVGKIPSHLSGEREIWQIKRKSRRENLDAYLGVDHPDRHKFTLEDWQLNGKQIIKGINVWNLLQYNIKWPEPNWWRVQARATYECLESKSDVKPWNLIVTPVGVKAIDFLTKFPEGDQAEYQPKQLEDLDKVFG